MSGLDLFAWIVLIVVLAVIVLVIWMIGSMPGHVARRRGHPWGRIYTSKVESVLQAVATGQTQVSGQAVMPKAIGAVPFVVRVTLDDAEVAKSLPAGATGTAAIFTDRVVVSHVIRRVLLRQIAILNYVVPF